jgi:hypothetical protein
MAHDKSLKCLTVAVSVALLTSIVLFLLSFLFKEPVKITVKTTTPPHSVTVGQ